jgi:hypothetical protein
MDAAVPLQVGVRDIKSVSVRATTTVHRRQLLGRGGAESGAPAPFPAPAICLHQNVFIRTLEHDERTVHVLIVARVVERPVSGHVQIAPADHGAGLARQWRR